MSEMLIGGYTLPELKKIQAKRVATDAGLEFNIDNLVYEVNSGNNWYNSNSTC